MPWLRMKFSTRTGTKNSSIQSRIDSSENTEGGKPRRTSGVGHADGRPVRFRFGLDAATRIQSYFGVPVLP